MHDQLSKHHFKNRVIGIFFLVAIIPLLLISIGSFFAIYSQGVSNVIELENLALSATNEKISKYLNQKLETFNLVVNTNPTNITDIDVYTLNVFIDNLKNTAGDIKQISFLDVDGNEIIKRSDTQDGSVMTSAKLQEIIFTLKDDKKYFGPIAFNGTQPSMVVASRLENSDRQTIGFVVAEIDLEPLQVIFNETVVGNGGYLYLLDSTGKFITVASTSNKIIGAKPGEQISAYPNLASAFEQYTPTFLNEYPIGDTSVIYNLKVDPATNWVLVAEWEKSKAFSTLNNLLLQTVIITLLTLLFVILLGTWAAKRIIRPINILIDSAKRVSDGDLNHCLYLNTNDDFEILAHNFNRMIEALRENRKLKDEFVFIAAHELRTPVTAIKGFLSMLIDGDFGIIPEKAQKALQTLFSANERLVQLVQDLLEVARNDSGKMSIFLEATSLNESITTTIKELSILAANKNITINFAEPKKVIMVHADQDKLKEIIVNLISNAIKYTVVDPANTAKNNNIDISIDLDKVMAKVHIKDHGLGMTDEDRKKLFTKFYRIRTDDTAKIEGTGLGLFICKEIVERMGGEINVESKVGEGSDFWFTVKLFQKKSTDKK